MGPAPALKSDGAGEPWGGCSCWDAEGEMMLRNSESTEIEAGRGDDASPLPGVLEGIVPVDGAGAEGGCW